MWICVTCSDENESWACIVEFPRGICLPSISSTEHFDQKKKNGEVQSPLLCVVIFS